MAAHWIVFADAVLREAAALVRPADDLLRNVTRVERRAATFDELLEGAGEVWLREAVALTEEASLRREHGLARRNARDDPLQQGVAVGLLGRDLHAVAC